MSPLRKIGLLLLVLVAVPVALVAAAELASLSENERLLREVNDRHVTSVLATINQHVWNVTDGWAGDLERRLTEADDADAALAGFLAAHPSLESAFVADTAVAQFQVVAASGAPRLSRDDLGLRAGHAQRLLADRASDYRRLLPLPLREEASNATVALAFVTDAETPLVAGFVLDADRVIETELTPKLQAAAQENFIIGIDVEGDLRYTIMPSIGALLGTLNPSQQARLVGGQLSENDSAELLIKDPSVQSRALWVFPDYTLRIRPVGATLQQIATDRFQRSLLLIGVLALALTVGAVLLFRTIRRQIDLARAKAVFVQNVSHELRTPLALIRMYAETLDLGRVPEARRQEYVRTIAQESTRLTRLVNNILNFSRIESGQQTLAKAPFDLNALAEEALGLYEVRLEQEDVTVERHLDDLPPAIGDREATSEAVVNLIDNAIKYGGDARHLSLTTGAGIGTVWLEVTDRGIGIPLREQAHIFDEFYRVPTGAVHDVKGTGLGLALVKHLAEAQGGRVTVRSAAGRGSTFRLTLPSAQRVAAPARPPEQAISSDPALNA